MDFVGNWTQTKQMTRIRQGLDMETLLIKPDAPSHGSHRYKRNAHCPAQNRKVYCRVFEDSSGAVDIAKVARTDYAYNST
jgi:hypothetical protein